MSVLVGLGFVAALAVQVGVKHELSDVLRQGVKNQVGELLEESRRAHAAPR